MDQLYRENEKKLQTWRMIWLNLVGRVILIKSILAAISLYQFATILALESVHKKPELIIRSVLSQGGKIETKIFSLVKWEQVTNPYEKGGLSIRLLGLMNLAFGEKIVWRFITGDKCWWKQVLGSKYLNAFQFSFLSGKTPIIPFSQIWKLIKNALPFIKDNTSKI